MGGPPRLGFGGGEPHRPGADSLGGVPTTFLRLLVIPILAVSLIAGCGDDGATDNAAEGVVPVEPNGASTSPEPEAAPDTVPDEPAGDPVAPDDSVSEFQSQGCDQLGLGITEIVAVGTDCDTAHEVASNSTGDDYDAEGFSCLVTLVEEAKPNNFHHYVCTMGPETITFRARQ